MSGACAQKVHGAVQDGGGVDTDTGSGECFQSVEHVLFNEGTDDFFVDFHGTREADSFTCQAPDAGAEGQVVTFNTLREDFAGQVFLLRLFSGVAAPVIAGYHAGTEQRQQG